MGTQVTSKVLQQIMRAIIFTVVLLAGVYAAVPEEVPALDGTAYMRRTPDGPYLVHGCGSSSVATSSSSSHYAAATSSSSTIIHCIGGCLTAAPTNGAIGNCGAVLSIGASCTPTCNSGYTISGNHTCASATGNVLQAATCTANPPPSPPANSSASAAAATGTETTVTQEYTFASLTVAQYTGDMKSNCECAYANTVEAATTPTWCVATPTTYTYKSGVALSSSAARRAAKVTFILKVKSSVKTTSQLQTMVASGSTATNFAAALAAVNTASNKTVAPGTATVATATFTGGSSSASTLLPSMLSLVAAIFVAARQ